MHTLSPLPTLGRDAFFQSSALATLRSPCFRSQSTGVSPGVYASPLSSRFLSRKSSGSMPSRLAIMSICDS